MNDVMCRGDYRLGTACGKCSRCVAAEALRPENQRVYPVGTERNWKAELDAQHLRADTAEAERDALRERHDTVKCQRNDANRLLAAAEQRIAEMSELLKRCIPVCRFKYSRAERDLINDITAALNPKPEAGSHE